MLHPIYNGVEQLDTITGRGYVSRNGSLVEYSPKVRPEMWDSESLSYTAEVQPVVKTDSLTVDVDFPDVQPVSGPLTDSELRVSDVKVTLDGEQVQNDPVDTAVSSNVTVGNTATKIPATEQAGRRLVVMYNGSDEDMYIGASDVTTSKGIKLATGSTMSIECSANLFGVCASGGKVLNVLECK